MPAREVAMSHLSCILSFDLIGNHQNKRFYVTEIVLSLMFADIIFQRKGSDDQKCVCGSQANKQFFSLGRIYIINFLTGSPRLGQHTNKLQVHKYAQKWKLLVNSSEN